MKTLRLADIVVDPHRVHLDRVRVDRLKRTVPDWCGIAVAYRPGTGYVLVGGEHRAAALAARNTYEAPVFVLSSWRDFLAWAMADLEKPGGLGWTAVDAAHLHNKVVPLFGPARTEKPGHDIAEFTGVNDGAIGNVRWTLGVLADTSQPQEVRNEIADLIANIARGGDGMHGLREAVRRAQDRHQKANAPTMPAAQQRKALESIAQLEGIIAALADMGPINPDLPQGEREHAAVRLGKLGATIVKIKKNLRGES